MRRALYCLAVLPLFVVFSRPAIAATTCDQISIAEGKLYGFRPDKITEAEQKQKSDAMDSYWNLVKHAGSGGVACLRSLLEKQQDGFAVFDEASLLLSLDHSAESIRVAAQAVARTNISAVQPADYVRMGLQLARAGADIEPIAHNYLNARSDVTAYLPLHGAYKLDRVAGAILLYGVLPTDEIDDALAKEVKSDFSEARNVAVVVWSMNLTARSFKGLSDLGAMDGFSDQAKKQVRSVLTPFEVPTTPPKYTRKQMLDKIGKFPVIDMDPREDFEAENRALDNSAYATLTVEDVGTLREARRKFITGVSNEAVEGYIEMSRILLNLINKLHLYSEYRTAGS